MNTYASDRLPEWANGHTPGGSHTIQDLTQNMYVLMEPGRHKGPPSRATVLATAAPLMAGLIVAVAKENGPLADWARAVLQQAGVTLTPSDDVSSR